MDGIFRKTVIIFLFLAILGCKKEEKIISKHDILISEGKAFIRQNLNILIDSIIQFDVPTLDKTRKKEELTVGLIDSVSYRDISNPYRYLGFKLKKTDLTNFKSSYKLKLVKENNNDANVLFITFSNFRMEKGHVFINVMKMRGIGMIREKYHFKKENGVWVFVGKRMVNMG